MRGQDEIVARLAATEAELAALMTTIQQLSSRVQAGEPGWLQALEVLAQAYQRRNALRVQRENLTWVLAPSTQVVSDVAQGDPARQVQGTAAAA
jgi:hypothetical protein